MDKPIFYLKFNNANADLEVRLNDIPVLELDSPGTTTSEKPVPENILDGENTLSVSVKPLEEGTTLSDTALAIDVSLIAREKGAPLDKYRTIIDIKIDTSEEPERILSRSHEKYGKSPPEIVKSEEKELRVQRPADIDSPFPRWAWQDGKTIVENDNNYNTIIEEYKNVYDALNSKEIDKIRSVYEEAAREFAAAYHYDDPMHGHRIMDTGSLAMDDDWALGNIQKLFDKNVPFYLDIYAKGKLARLVNERETEAFIVFYNKKLSLYSYQKFGFYKTKDGDWIMIR